MGTRYDCRLDMEVTLLCHAKCVLLKPCLLVFAHTSKPFSALGIRSSTGALHTPDPWVLGTEHLPAPVLSRVERHGVCRGCRRTDSILEARGEPAVAGEALPSACGVGRTSGASLHGQAWFRAWEGLEVTSVKEGAEGEGLRRWDPACSHLALCRGTLCVTSGICLPETPWTV